MGSKTRFRLICLAIAALFGSGAAGCAEDGSCLRHTDCASGEVCQAGTCFSEKKAPIADGGAEPDASVDASVDALTDSSAKDASIDVDGDADGDAALDADSDAADAALEGDAPDGDAADGADAP